MYPVSTSYPVSKPTFFEKKVTAYDKTQRITIYRLNVEKLSKDECHMFWDFSSLNARLIATALEFITFHPHTKLNEKFNITPIPCDDSLLFLCSFPKEYKEICRRAAKTFGMHITNTWIVMASTKEREDLIDPSLALTLSYDHKERRVPFKEHAEKEKPVSKGALKECVKKHTHTTFFEIPKSDNILWFEGRSFTEPELNRLEEEITEIGNSLQKLGLD